MNEPELTTTRLGAGGAEVSGDNPERLGSGRTVPTKQLDTFENPAQDLDYTIVLDIPEFTCLCPISGQPDFAQFKIEYRPDQKCVETKSLKLYMWSFRNEGAFHEAVTNSILRDLVKVMEPKWIKITGVFNARGGITPTIISEWRKEAQGPF
jgi:7-cyano-7-deazaguanine reductase